MGIVAQNTPFQFDFNRFLLFAKGNAGIGLRILFVCYVTNGTFAKIRGPEAIYRMMGNE